MKIIFKKFFRTLVACAIILLVGIVITSLINLIEYFCPILSWIISIGIFLITGYLFGNDFE
jgi:hypothetical protein